MPAPHQPPFDAFVFDLDGTLLDTLPDLVVLTNQVLREMGWPERTEAEILSYVGNGVRALMYQAVPDGTTAADAERAMDRWKELFPVYPNDLTRPYPGIVELLAELRARGCKVGVVSNKFEPGVHQIIGKCLPGLIDQAHGEAPGIPRKPDPTGILRTLDELGVAPGRAVFVGDSPGDIVAGHNAGTYTVAVEWGYHPVADFAKARPDMLAAAPADLLNLAPEGQPRA